MTDMLWECSHCHKLNYSYNEYCNICGAPKPDKDE